MIDLSHLDDDQRLAATAPRGPVAILAGAGTGKTRTITYRLAYLIDQGFTSPQRVMAVTFTKRAAAEMVQRIRQMGIGGVQARTFHAAAFKQLSYFWPKIAGNNLPWRLVDKKFPLIRQAAHDVGIRTTPEHLRDLLSEIEWAKASLVLPETYAEKASHRSLPDDPETIAKIFQRYEQLKTTPEGMLLDYDDLLIHVAGALTRSPAIAEEFREQYRTFVVDEYQDVTPLQQRVLEAWLGDRDDLTVVGDANQTIYSFTGATPDYLLNFERTYPHATVVKLQRDYRSTPEVTELANTVIDQATGRMAKTRLRLQGMRKSGPKPVFTAYDDESAEARGVARRIQQLLRDGVPASEIAILYRINAQSAVFEQALESAGIIYQVRGGEEFFQRREIQQAMTALRNLAQRDDLPAEAVGPEIHRLVRAALAPLGFGPEEPTGTQARERWQSFQALVSLTEQLGHTIPDLTLPGLLLQLQQRAEAKHPPVMNGVTLASLHAAKGLEWDAVFLVGLTEGSLPISHAIKAGDAAIEEERRLFYVGVTRAREYLFHSWAFARQEGGRKSRKRTRFLDTIVVDPPTREMPTKAAHAKVCQACGQMLTTPAQRVVQRCDDCPSPANMDVYEALRQWRSATAHAQEVPAYIIFTDATLLAIAEQLPTDEAGLLNISGIGPVKVERFGAELLAVIAAATAAN